MTVWPTLNFTPGAASTQSAKTEYVYEPRIYEICKHPEYQRITKFEPALNKTSNTDQNAPQNALIWSYQRHYLPAASINHELDFTTHSLSLNRRRPHLHKTASDK